MNLILSTSRIVGTETKYAIFLDEDIRFHAAVAEAAGNVVLCELTRITYMVTGF